MANTHQNMISNNIFDFATSELSQDAFICWCLNWINVEERDDTRAYRKLGLHLLSRLLSDIDGNALKIYETSRVTGIEIVRQLLKIDILILVPELKVALIIEDKTNSSEHHNQLSRYKYMLSESLGNREYDSKWADKNIEGFKSDDEKLNKSIESARWTLERINSKYDTELSDYTIHTAYFKTSWYDDRDWETVLSIDDNDGTGNRNTYITGATYLNLLKASHKEIGIDNSLLDSHILASYIDYLEKSIQNNINNSRFWEPGDGNSHFKIQQYYAAQRIFLLNLFDPQNNYYHLPTGADNMSIDKASIFIRLYGLLNISFDGQRISHGSSYGKPWTHIQFWRRTETNTDYYGVADLSSKPYLFWRITNTGGRPLLALRYYTRWEKGVGDTGNNDDQSYKSRVFNHIIKTIHSTEIIQACIHKMEKFLRNLDECNKDNKNSSSKIYITSNPHKYYENTVLEIPLEPVLRDWTKLVNYAALSEIESSRHHLQAFDCQNMAVGDVFQQLFAEFNERLTTLLSEVDWADVRQTPSD